MAMKNLFLYSTLFVMLMGCGGTKEFTEQDNQDYRNLQDLVAAKTFEIISNRAIPTATAAMNRVANSRLMGPGNSANNIDITTNANYLKVKGDSIQGFLPFFGEQNFGGGYNGNHNGIEFNDVPKEYEVINNDKKHTVDIKFKIEDEYRHSDRYEVQITLYPNNRSTIRVESSARTSIEYTGRVSKLEEVKE